MDVLLDAWGEWFTSKIQGTIDYEGIWPQKGVDFNEIFSLVVNVIYLDSVGYGRSMDLEVEQLDVKIAFLHGDL